MYINSRNANNPRKENGEQPIYVYTTRTMV